MTMALPLTTTMHLLADSTTADPLLGKFSWVLLAAIVVTFLAVGLRDVGRLSWMRISAISSVSFAESIRRRVLWITPLAILGAIVVGQMQNALDPQDERTQTMADLNRRIAADERVESVLLGLSDGVTLARKRA